MAAETKSKIPQNPKSAGFIGLGYTDIYKGERVTGYSLNMQDPLYIDFGQKEHTMIVAKSGSGKSYLAGVLAEESIRVLRNTSIVMFDRMGIFSTLKLPGEQNPIDLWNGKCAEGYFNIKANGLPNIEVWIPKAELNEYDPEMYDHVFAIKPKDISTYVFCLSFGLGISDQQTNLFRKAKRAIQSEKSDYSLFEFIDYINEHSESWHYKVQTVDALISKLETLHELGITDENGIEISRMIRRNSIIVIDVSGSDEKTASLVVNFMTEAILRERANVAKKIRNAKIRKIRVFLPHYIPNCHLIVDEAHNFLPGNEIFAKIIKEGRNIGLKVTAISQSPDLTKELYDNISHLFIGVMNNDGNISFLKGILPTSEDLKTFRSQVKQLERGAFIYYNLRDKTRKKIRVRPRQTLHTANTEIDDETQYLLETPKTLVQQKLELPQSTGVNSDELDDEGDGYDLEMSQKDKQFFEFNLDIDDSEQTEKQIKVQSEIKKPETIKEKTTEEKLIDERKPICFSNNYSKLSQSAFSTIRLTDIYKTDKIYWIKTPQRWGKAKLIFKHQRKLSELATEFLMQDTDTKTRSDAIAVLKKYFTMLTDETILTILRLEWIE